MTNQTRPTGSRTDAPAGEAQPAPRFIAPREGRRAPQLRTDEEARLAAEIEKLRKQSD